MAESKSLKVILSSADRGEQVTLEKVSFILHALHSSDHSKSTETILINIISYSFFLVKRGLQTMYADAVGRENVVLYLRDLGVP